MATTTHEVTYVWTGTAIAGGAPWRNVQIVGQDTSCAVIEWEILPEICDDLPAPDPCNQLPVECPASVRYIVEQAMFEINNKALSLADPRLAVMYDEWRFLDRKVREIAPTVATLLDGIPTISRIKVAPGRNIYCLPADYGYITKATFGAEDVKDNQVEVTGTPFCALCSLHYNQYFLQKEHVGNWTGEGEKTGFPRGFAVNGTTLILDRKPLAVGEIRIWHRSNTLLTEDCGCDDMVFETCQCHGTKPQSRDFINGVSVKYLAIVIKLLIGEWFTMKEPPLAKVYVDQGYALIHAFSQVSKPELGNTLVRRTYRGF